MTLEQKIALLAETIETDSKNLISTRSLDSFRRMGLSGINFSDWNVQ